MEYWCLIKNLPSSTTISQVKDSFKVFGNVLDVKVLVDFDKNRTWEFKFFVFSLMAGALKVTTHSSKVLAYVCFDEESSLKAAMSAKNRTVFHGKIIIVDTVPSGVYDDTYSRRDKLLDEIVIINGVHRRKVDGARKKGAGGKGNSGEGPSDVR